MTTFSKTTPRRAITITGGAGFIGVNLADRALTDGHQVTILDDLSRRGAGANVAWLRERHGDKFSLVQDSVVNSDACNRAIAGVEVVYHLAAQTAVTTSILDPRHDFMVNALGTFNVLEAARLSGSPPVVLYASTNKVYGAMEDLAIIELPTRHAFRDLPDGIDESRSLDFHSPYGCSKGAAEQYVRDYARVYGLRTVVFRQSCVYGPRQMGVEDQGWVAWFVIALITGKPLTIFGDGKQVRDLLHVNDLLNAYEAAVDRIDQVSGEVYNMGGGSDRAISIWWELQPMLEAALDRILPAPTFAPIRQGDQPVFIANTGKAQRELGWSPEISVAEGIEQLTNWIRANLALVA